MNRLKLWNLTNGRIAIIVTVCLVLAFTATILYLAQAPPNVDPKLREAVMQALIDKQLEYQAHGYKSPENSIFVDITNQNPQELPSNWRDTPNIGIWIYEHGTIRPATQAELDAFKKERKDSEYIFAVRENQNGTALVEIAQHYSKGPTPGFGQFSGQAENLTFKRTNLGWIVTSRETTWTWD